MNTTSQTKSATAEAGGARKFSKARALAQRVGISKRTLFRWADAGHITRHKVNERVVLFDDSEVIGFIQSSATTAREEVVA